MFSETTREYLHTHCWCQLVYVQPIPEVGITVIAHDQCCVCGDRRVAPPAGASKREIP